MAWASRRETTRVEDEAYSLMGIFGVNMPLLYGEGRNAFQRLQLEILKSTDDDSIFCWRDERERGDLLACSPKAFELSSDIRLYHEYDSYTSFISILSSPSTRGSDSADRDYFHRTPYPTSLTNKGLQISIFLIPLELLDIQTYSSKKGGCIFGAIFQGLTSGSRTYSPAVLLQRKMVDTGNDIDLQDWTCYRIECGRFFALNMQKVRSLCEAQIAKLRPSMITKFLAINESDHRYPRSRVIYVKGFSWNASHSRYETKVNITFDTRSLQTKSFSISKPVPFIEQEDELSSNMLAWNESSGQYQLNFCRISHRGPHHFHIYFTNRTTEETILYIVFMEFSGRVSVCLLKLDINKRFKIFTISSLLQDRLMGLQSHAIGVDRVSILLRDGSTVSATIRATRESPDLIDYDANIVVGQIGTSFWTPPLRHSRLTDYLAEKMVDRDQDSAALEKYLKVQRQMQKY